MKGQVKDGKKYYKYVYRDFVQPQMTWNGIIGDLNTMAVSASFSRTNWTRGPIYNAFWPNTGTMGFYCDEYYGYMEVYMYVPKPLKLTGIYIQSIYEHNSCGGVYNPRMWGGRAWGWQDEALFYYDGLIIGEGQAATLYSSTQNYYQYFRLYMGNGTRSYNDRMIVSNLRLYGQTREIVEGTPDNYDFYINDPDMSVFYDNEESKYYAMNSYEKGQYFTKTGRA